MNTISRRTFQTGAAASILLAPFLKPSKALAAPKQARFCIVLVSQAPPPRSYETSGGSSIFTDMSAPFAAIKDDVAIVSNISISNSGHGSPSPLCACGYGGGSPSIETFIGKSIPDPGLKKVVLLGSEPEGDGVCYFQDNGISSKTFISPMDAYDQLLAGAGGGGGGNMSKEETLALLRKRKSVLDLINEDIKRAKTDIDSASAARLDAHLTSIREFERALEKKISDIEGSGSAGPAPTLARPTANGSTIVSSLGSHMDIAAHVLAAGISRSVGVTIGSHKYTFFSDISGLSRKMSLHDDIIHGGNRQAHLVVEHWLINQYVYLVKKLKSLPMPDGDGTLYDHTAIVWARDFGDAGSHNGERAVYVVSGGAGGFLRKQAGGLYIDGGGTSHKKILSTLAAAMGVNDLKNFGVAGDPDKVPFSPLIA